MEVIKQLPAHSAADGVNWRVPQRCEPKDGRLGRFCNGRLLLGDRLRSEQPGRHRFRRSRQVLGGRFPRRDDTVEIFKRHFETERLFLPHNFSVNEFCRFFVHALAGKTNQKPKIETRKEKSGLAELQSNPLIPQFSQNTGNFPFRFL